MMHAKDVDAFADAFVDTIKRALQAPQARIVKLEECRDALFERLAAMEAELYELKGTTLKAGDIWQLGKSYLPGDTCTYGGSLWQCHMAHVADGPGVDHDCWRLAVKRGRDGKDAR